MVENTKADDGPLFLLGVFGWNSFLTPGIKKVINTLKVFSFSHGIAIFRNTILYSTTVTNAVRLIKIMRIEKHKYPIRLLEEFESIITKLRDITRDNNLIVLETEPNDNALIRFEFIDSKCNFFFEIANLKLDSNQIPIYENFKAPASEVETQKGGNWARKDVLIHRFNSWIQILERYRDLKFMDSITARYQDDIFENLKILDENADELPFDDNQQIVLLNYLKRAKNHLKDNSEEFNTAMVIEEIDILSKEVPSLSKNGNMKRLSSILAKTKKQSLKLFYELLEMFKKDVMKKLIPKAYEYIQEAIAYLQQLNN